MNLVTIFVIAFSLAADALAVSIVIGSVHKQLKINHALKIAIFFGGFQALMPLIGSLATAGFKARIAHYGHWIAMGLLTAVGTKMIFESFKIKKTEKDLDPANIFVLLILSVATSIDALAVGITLPIIIDSITLAVCIIGIVTFVLSYLGVFVGRRFGHFFESKIEAFGGIVLIGLGLKILFEHLLF